MSVVVVLVLLSLTHVGSAGATDIPTTTYLVNTTWTAANSPYVLDGSVTIASGATLTIEPGVVVKFNGTSRSIFVNGALNASGTPSGPIYFTSLADDSIGGDTRGNGPTTGAPGQWAQIKVANGSYLSQLRNVVVRYGGSGFGNANAEIYVNGATSALAIADGAVTDSKTTGIDTYLGSSSVSGTTIARNTMNGIYVDHGRVTVDHAAISGNGTWGIDFLINSAPYPPASPLFDNSITSNGSGGIRMWGASGTPSWPYGNRNRIFGNNSGSPSANQLYNIGLPRTTAVDWSGNYWGPDVHWVEEPAACNGAGYLAFNSGGAPTPLFWWGAWPNQDCYVNVPSLGAGPINVQPPYITGLANVDEILVGAHGDWTNSSTNFQYQWQRCDSAGASCVDLFGQTGPQYQLLDADLGSRFRVKVTATNSSGATSAISEASLLILPRIASLAYSYRPALMFDSGEHWRPLDADMFLEEGIHQLCVVDERFERPSLPQCKPITSATTFEHGPVDPVTQQEQNTYGLDPAEWWSYVDIAAVGGSSGDASSYKSPYGACYQQPAGSTVVLRDCDGGTSPTIYYDYGQDATGFRYIDYWFFYRYNEIFGDNHQGDWEGLTTVLNGDSTDPRVAGVIFGQHKELTWELPTALCWSTTCESTQPSGSGHVTTFPASGSHASYEFMCSDSCPNPIAGLPEGDHDGAASWSLNVDSSCYYGVNCVKPLPAGAERWTIWPGWWGSDPGSVAGTAASPRSPGTQARFTCTQTGWDCPERQWSRRRANPTSRVPNPKICHNWRGVSVVVLACDPGVLRTTIRRHQTARRGRFHIEVAGRRSGDTAGLVQVIGLPLHAGETVRFSGTPTARTSLAVQVQLGHRVFEITARRIALHSHTGAVRLGVKGGKLVIAWSRGVQLVGLHIGLMASRT
jgi:hypothetical protein